MGLYPLPHRPNRPTAMEIDPLPADLSPTGVGVDHPLGRLTREELDGDSRVISQTHARVGDRVGAEVFGRPVHHAERGRRKRAARSSRAEGTFDLE